MALESTAVGEVGAAVAAGLAHVPNAESGQSNPLLRVLVLPLYVLCQLRRVAVAAATDSAAVDGDCKRLPTQLCGVVAFLRGVLDRPQQALLRDARLALSLELERVAVLLLPAARHLSDGFGVRVRVSLHGVDSHVSVDDLDGPTDENGGSGVELLDDQMFGPSADLSEPLEGEVLEESEDGLPPHQEERRLP